MHTKNALPEICELNIRIDTNVHEGEEINCVAEFRLYKGDIPLGDEECEITISKATISINTEGLEPKPGTRYGEPKKKNTVPITKTTQQKNNKKTDYLLSGGMKAGLDSAIPHLAGNASKSGSTEQNSCIETAETTEHLRVRALPNLRWEVSEPKDDPLDGTYLENDTLLSMNRLSGANRTSFTATVTVKQRHLQIRQIIQDDISIKFFNRLSTNQRRLLDIFIAKSLSSALNWKQSYRGEIILSEHKCEDEDEE